MYPYLLMGVNIDVALDALLPHVGPGVPAHPLPLAFGAFIFTKTPLLALVGGETFTFGSSLSKKSQHLKLYVVVFFVLHFCFIYMYLTEKH